MNRRSRSIAIATSLLLVGLLTYFAYFMTRPCESYMREELSLLARIVDRIEQFKQKNHRLPYPESRDELALLGLSPGGEPHYFVTAPGQYELFGSKGVVEPILTQPGEVVMGFDGPWVKYISSNASYSCGHR